MALPDCNCSLHALLMRQLGSGEELRLAAPWRAAFEAVRWSTLAGLLGLLALRRRRLRTFPTAAAAAGTALLAWLLIFSPVYGEHYVAYLAPAWGLALTVTADRDQPAPVRLLGIGGLALLWAPAAMLAIGRIHLPEWVNSHVLVGTAAWLAASVWLLGVNPGRSDAEGTDAAGHASSAS